MNHTPSQCTNILKSSFINITQEDYRRKSGVPTWKLIPIQERKKRGGIHVKYTDKALKGDRNPDEYYVLYEKS